MTLFQIISAFNLGVFNQPNCSGQASIISYNPNKSNNFKSNLSFASYLHFFQIRQELTNTFFIKIILKN
ncbi:hypothetical protein GW891_00845 [bacterium]|nr:hypothetical protein [bacterium]